MSATTSNPFSSSPLHALNVDIVVEQIISYLVDNPVDLLPYRLVSHKWNDAIVRKINKADYSFKIPLRYGPQVPMFLTQFRAQDHTREILDDVILTLTGSASRLNIDSVVVDRDFFLAGVMNQWTHFLKIHGKSIRHAKFSIRRGDFPRRFMNYVEDCEQVISMENFRVFFISTPNLESLDFCVRFSHYGPRTSHEAVVRQRIFPDTKRPKLRKLTKINIEEPRGFFYSRLFLKEIFSMTCNLEKLYIKPTGQVGAFISALTAIPRKHRRSLTSFGISNASVSSGTPLPKRPAHMPAESYVRLSLCPFGFLCRRRDVVGLAELEINNIYGGSWKKPLWIKLLIMFQRPSLVKLTLGNRRNNTHRGNLAYELVHAEHPRLNLWARFTFSDIFPNLKILEVNLDKFNLAPIRCYKTLFPVLEQFTLSHENEDGWSYEQLSHLLPQHFGMSETVKHFYLIGPMWNVDRDEIDVAISLTFPKAALHFDPLLHDRSVQKWPEARLPGVVPLPARQFLSAPSKAQI